MCSQRFFAVAILLLGSLHSISSNSTNGNIEGVKILKLTNLFPEIQLLILDELDLPDWLSLAETNKEYSAFIGDELKRKYLKDRTLVIENPYLKAGKPIGEHIDSTFVRDASFGFTVKNDKFIIKHLGAALIVLRLVGDSVTKLSYKCGFSSRDDVVQRAMSKIGRYINKYCADSLIEFDIVNYGEHFLKEMSSPFKRVEKLSIQGNFETFDSETLPFEELFTAMRKLSLRRFEINGINAVDRRFPNLGEIHVDLYRLPSSFQEEQFKALLIKNPQIHSLSLEYGSRSLLNVASEHLHLELLSIYRNKFNLTDSSPIVFGNVKNFTLIAFTDSCIPHNILFPRLVEFRAYGRDQSEAKLIEFVQVIARNSTSLRKLAVTKYAYAVDDFHRNGQVIHDFLHDEQVKKLSEHELQLEDIHLALNGDVADETIVNFLRMNQKTKRILFSRDFPLNSFRNVVNTIRVEFADNWSILKADGEILLESEF